VEQREEIAAQALDREGVQVVLPARIWTEKILCIHPELETFLADVMRTVEAPDCLEPDPRPSRLRCFSRGVGPTAWLLVVVSYEQKPARVITAYGYRKDPLLWKLPA
jgi:hypothetical protein